MIHNCEHSPESGTASNQQLRPLLQELLELARRATGAERVYVVARGRDPGAAPRIAACVSAREDRDRRPSLTVASHTLQDGRPFASTDLAAERRFRAGESVRALALRSAVAMPLRLGPGQPAALILDSRRRPALPLSRLRELAGGFAALVEQLARGVLGTADARPREAVPVGRSPAFLEMLRWTSRVAACDLPVLIRGETGSGKERAARHLHRQSARAAGPFVAVNCAALADSLLEAELFGSVRGAYTGAEHDRPGLFRIAAGGTLFLDEVAEMSPAMQSKLLRALQEGEVRPVGSERNVVVDVRVVAATHVDLEERSRQDGFRRDLLYRLAVVEIVVPPLRARLEDLEPLVHELGRRLLQQTSIGPPRLSAEAWTTLRAHSWPGNVRELHAVLARALLRSAGEEITPRHLLPLGSLTPGDGGRAEAATSESLESRMIRESIRNAGGNLTGAADRIGWTRQKLYRRIRALGMEVRRPGMERRG